jgi:hypothetical protein
MLARIFTQTVGMISEIRARKEHIYADQPLMLAIAALVIWDRSLTGEPGE